MEQEMKNLPPDADIGTQKRPIIAILVAALILIVLLAPCILAATSSTIYPRTTVAGISVGGMTRAEAQAVLERELDAVYETAALPITVSGEDGTSSAMPLSLSALHIQTDAGESAAAAWTNGREDVNFFTGGIAYAKGLLLGHKVAPALAVDESSLRAQVAALAEQADQPVVECSWRIEGDTMYVVKPKAGYLVDQNALCEQVMNALREHDLSGISCALQKTEPAAVTMAEVYNDAHRNASNAYYDKESGTVKEGESSVEFDAAQAQEAMDAAAEGTEFSVAVTVTRPQITREDMEKNLFRDKLGSCTTGVSGSANRKHNVSLAAASCNGVVLNPGEVFSYNSTLGERTAANGYRTAGAYVNGKTVNEYGGGICQISSTLYLAVLRSNLEIVSRTNHMFYPGYIPLGMDATVSWGGPDFQFRNNTDYPIKIVASYANGSSTCTIYGTNVAGTSVKMEYTVLSSTAYQTVEQEDLTLNPGERRQEQNGYTGYKVATYRCVYDSSGALLSRTLEANSSYKSRDRIILIGPAVQPTEAESGDPSADETLSGSETAPGGNGISGGTEQENTTPEDTVQNTPDSAAAQESTAGMEGAEEAA